MEICRMTRCLAVSLNYQQLTLAMPTQHPHGWLWVWTIAWNLFPKILWTLVNCKSHFYKCCWSWLMKINSWYALSPGQIMHSRIKESKGPQFAIGGQPSASSRLAGSLAFVNIRDPSTVITRIYAVIRCRDSFEFPSLVICARIIESGMLKVHIVCRRF